MPDLEALLARIGLDRPVPATVAGLRELHRAYVRAIPYEALAVQLEEFEALDVDAIQHRVLSGRGGYCFELNGLLAWLLEQSGFDVQRREAVVGLRGEPKPTNHLALVVRVGERDWLADAGLGEGPLEPLPLIPGRHPAAQGSPLHWTLERDDPTGGWWLHQHPWGTVRTVHVTAPTVTLDAFQRHHRRLSTDPDSSFVQTLVVQRTLEDRIVTLRARTLSIDGPDHRERHELADAEAFAAVLRDRFGVDPDTLGPERIGRLWQRALAQHERHLAALDSRTSPSAVR